MDSYRRRPLDTILDNSSESSAGAALEDAGRLLLRLIPFPGGADALPALAIPPLSLRGAPAKGSPVPDVVPDAVRQPADAIVSAAAAILVDGAGCDRGSKREPIGPSWSATARSRQCVIASNARPGR